MWVFLVAGGVMLIWVVLIVVIVRETRSRERDG